MQIYFCDVSVWLPHFYIILVKSKLVFDFLGSIYFRTAESLFQWELQFERETAFKAQESGFAFACASIKEGRRRTMTVQSN